MALTKISTGGVKDDAVTAGKIPANAIGSSEIASNAVTVAELAVDAVEDDRIKTSNSPAAGKFLQYKDASDKLTWADANQYTHPDHSGEVTSSADGATTIASNIVDEDNLKISNAGTNGQFLQKQSGNTGGLTWETINASPSLTANANGALAAGDPVAMQTDGTVKKIFATITNDSAPSNAISDAQVSSGTVDNQTLAISPEGIGLCLYTDGHSNFSSSPIRVRAFKLEANDTITRASSSVGIGAGTYEDFRIIWSITNNGNPVFIIQYRGTSDNSNDTSHTNTTTRYCPLMVNASSLAVTRGTGITQSENCKEPDIIRSGTSGEFLALQPIQGTCYWRIYKYDNSSSTVGNISLEDYAHQGRHQGGYSGGGDGCDVSFRYSSLLHDPDRDEILLFTQDEANGSCTMQYDKGQTVWLDIWNSTDFNTTGVASPKITRPKPWNTNHVGMTNRLQARYINSCYDTTNDRVVVVFCDEDQSDKTYIMAGTNNGKSSASISWGTPVELDANECYSVQCVFDPNQEKVLVSYGDPGDSNKFKWVLCTVNSSNNSVSIGTVFTDTHIWDTSDYNSNERGGPVYDAINKRYVRFYRKDADMNNGYLFAAKTSSSTTTPGEFIGFSNAVVSSGAAASIDITGSVNENQSSLTTGSKYYVNNQGGLQTTADNPSRYAGIAASATKIIVKG